jgi:membrane fusion protein
MQNSSDDLFREEARNFKQHRFHGQVLLVRPWTYAGLTLFFCGIALILLVFSFYFGFTRKEMVEGLVVPDHGVIRVTAPQAGVIKESHLVDGKEVRIGDALFVLSNETSNSLGATQANITESLRSRQQRLKGEIEQVRLRGQIREKEYGEHFKNLEMSLEVLRNENKLQRKKVQLVRETVERYSTLEKAGTISKIALNEKAVELLDYETRLSAIELQEKTLQSELLARSSQKLDSPRQTAIDTSLLERSLEEVQQQINESEVKRELLIRAEQNGRISNISADIGQTVSSGQRIASLLPSNSKLNIALFAPSRSIGFIHVGTTVLLRFDAYPYQQFGQLSGKITEVSHSTVTVDELRNLGLAVSTTSGVGSEGMYQLRVVVDSEDLKKRAPIFQLKPGMQLSANLVLEQRSIIDWIFAPISALTK